MGHHGTQGEYLVSRKAPCRNHVKGGIRFCVAEDGFLRTPTIVEQNHALCRICFVGDDNLVIELIITRLEQMQLERPFNLFLVFPSCENESVGRIP